jgi:hypothetical protein
MGIASFTGASSVIKPGVVTSSTRPSSPFVGQLIYETDTNRLAAYNGSAWVTQNALQLVKTQTINTAVSSVEVTDAFNSTYDSYKITISGGVGSTSQNIALKFGATATGYYSSYFRTTSYSSATYDGQINNNTTSFPDIGFGSTGSLYLSVEVLNPNLAKPTFVSAPYIRSDTTALGAGQQSGFLAGTTQYTSFTLTASTGTMTGGTIRVYGYANS